MDELRRPEARTRVMYKIVFWVSVGVIASVAAYGIAQAAAANSFSRLGPSLVEANLAVEPATFLSVAIVTSFYAGVRLWQNKLARWSHFTLASIQLLAIVLAFVSAYEVMYDFMLWGSYSSLQLLQSQEIAALGTGLIGPAIPWTLVFGAKFFSAILVVSGYGVYFLRKVHAVRGLADL